MNGTKGKKVKQNVVVNTMIEYEDDGMWGRWQDISQHSQLVALMFSTLYHMIVQKQGIIRDGDLQQSTSAALVHYYL